MHSFTHENTGVTIHHNGDYSGEAKIMIPARYLNDRPWEEIFDVDSHGTLTINVIPAAALAALSHSAVISQVISAVENLPEPQHGLDH